MTIDSKGDGIHGSYEVLSRVGPLIGTTAFSGYQVLFKKHIFDP